MERIVIPGRATYAPIALTDLMLAAPLASRLLLGMTGPGQVVAAASMGAYAGSAARDWVARRGVRPIDFAETFSADVDQLEIMPLEARRWELPLLGAAMNESFVDDKLERPEIAQRVDRALTSYIASITGQEIVTSVEVRGFNIARLLMPSALGTCDMISGDVAVFQDLGMLEPHVIAHEFCHRKGYMKELHAQALSYMALRTSADPVLIQSARLERLHRQLRVVQRLHSDPLTPHDLVGMAHLRPELRDAVLAFIPEPDTASRFDTVMRKVYDARMRLGGQNGITDYDEGFTSFLWTVSRSKTARVPRWHAAL